MNNFTNILLRWFAENARALPWRETRDPYAIWLSEIILQQTRIQQGMDYWHRFIRRWPSVAQLAAASEDEVLREWQGLGYYSRARHLHEAAQQIAQKGRFPDTYEGIRQLRGVGDYTAAAVASIAFDLPYAVVDGNVYRVLARYFGIDTPIYSTQGKRLFSSLAQSLLPPRLASAFNQAMMDFGALQCIPQSPRCANCPLQDSCDALRTGRVAQLPVRGQKKPVQIRQLHYIYIRCQGFTAIHRRPKGDIWQGLWECWNVPVLPTNLPLFPLCQNFRHILTHRILLADFHLYIADERPSLPADYIWIQESDLDRYAKPRLIERLLQSLPD